MQWSEAVITVVTHVWKEEASNVTDVQKRMLNIGQVICYNCLAYQNKKGDW